MPPTLVARKSGIHRAACKSSETVARLLPNLVSRFCTFPSLISASQLSWTCSTTKIRLSVSIAERHPGQSQRTVKSSNSSSTPPRICGEFSVPSSFQHFQSSCMIWYSCSRSYTRVSINHSTLQSTPLILLRSQSLRHHRLMKGPCPCPRSHQGR